MSANRGKKTPARSGERGTSGMAAPGTGKIGTPLAPGLHTWTAYHREWKDDVRCAMYLSGRSVVLIDPLVPAGRKGTTFWTHLDALLSSRDLPLHILLTVFWHERSAPGIVARHPNARVWCPPGGELSLPARRFGAGVRLPAGVRAFRTARPDEVVLWIERARTLLAGDIILGGKRRPLRLCPAGWLPGGISRTDLARSLKPLRRLPVQVVHVGHGDPVTTGARSALADALDAAWKAGTGRKARG